MPRITIGRGGKGVRYPISSIAGTANHRFIMISGGTLRGKPDNQQLKRKRSNEEDPLFDPTTGLYSYHRYFDQIERTLARQKSLGLIYIDAGDLSKVEHDYGADVYRDVLKQTAQYIDEVRGTLIRKNDLLTVRNPHDEVFLIFLYERRSEYKSQLKLDDLQGMIDRFAHILNSRILKLTYPYTKKLLKVNIGYDYAIHNPLLAVHRVVYRLIESARANAESNSNRFITKVQEELKDLIIEENLRTVYQPIVKLQEMQLLGFEALSRGPENTVVENPLILFTIANASNLSFELDRLCRKKALENAKGLTPGLKLFINTFPSTLHDPEFKGSKLRKLLRDLNLTPKDIIFEITERFAIENYELFRKKQTYYQDYGFSVAIDDIGSGYGSLEAVAQLKPEFIKLDMSLVRDIHKSGIKKEVLQVIVDLAKKIRASIIAEGIENDEELQVLRQMGVDLGQGFHLGRPTAPPISEAWLKRVETRLRNITKD